MFFCKEVSFLRSFEYDNSTLIERGFGIFAGSGFCGKRLIVKHFDNEIMSVCLHFMIFYESVRFYE